MKDTNMSQKQLLNELAVMRQRVAELERLEIERKKTKEAFPENEEMFRLFMELSPIYVFFKDENTRAILVSKNYETMLRRPLYEIIGKTVDALFPSDLAKGMIEDDLRILREGKPIEVMEELNGRFYTTTKFPIKREGKPSPLAGFTIDITEHKKAEEALKRKSEEQVLLLDNIQTLIWYLKDLEAHGIVNKACADFWGKKKEDLENKKMGDVLPKEAAKICIAGNKEVFEKKIQIHTEERVVNAKGEERLLAITKTPKLDERGNIEYVVCSAADITEAKRAEEALRQSEERYRTIIDSIEDGYFEVDLAGNFTFYNDSLCRQVGYSKEEMMGMNNRQYMDKDTAKKVYQEFNRVYTTKEPLKIYNWEVTRRDGTKRTHEGSVSLIRNAKGEALGFRGITRDVTERKCAEEEKNALQEQLRQSQKMEAIGQLAGGIAHDFNNLLTIMRTHSQLALMELKEGDPFREAFRAIDEATSKSANLVRQILAFSRRQVMEMIVLDLNDLLRGLEKMLHRIIGEDIQFLTVLGEDLGRVRADPGQIEQVVFNLAVNSRDAMPGGGRLTIETTNVELDEAYAHRHVAVTPGRYVMLAVSDTGTGMTPEVRDRVFEPFFTTKEGGKGTGLGLSTVYGIVKQSGGNIWVYSEPGHGTTFKVYFPRVDNPLTRVTEKEESESFRGAGVILVVEDEELVRKVVKETLEKLGYCILEAGNEEEALLIRQRYNGTIHLALIDVVLPQISGPELAERLVLLHPEMKVLYMSGYANHAIVHHGVLKEGVNFIQKPFTIQGLARKVREVLGKDTKPAS